MALNKAALMAAIRQAFTDQTSKEDNGPAAIADLASKIADAVDTFVKSGTVNTTVTGTCATPSGPGTIAGTGIGNVI